MNFRARLLLLTLFGLPCFRLGAAPPPPHDQFKVALYIPVFVVEKMKDSAFLEASWKQLSSQVRVDKVYIETYRRGTIAADSLLDTVKRYTKSRGVRVHGRIAYVGARDTA